MSVSMCFCNVIYQESSNFEQETSDYLLNETHMIQCGCGIYAHFDEEYKYYECGWSFKCFNPPTTVIHQKYEIDQRDIA